MSAMKASSMLAILEMPSTATDPANAGAPGRGHRRRDQRRERSQHAEGKEAVARSPLPSGGDEQSDAPRRGQDDLRQDGDPVDRDPGHHFTPWAWADGGATSIRVPSFKSSECSPASSAGAGAVTGAPAWSSTCTTEASIVSRNGLG